MIKVNQMIQSQDISEMKKESLYQLSKEKHIQSFMKMYHIDLSLMEDYWVELLDYNDDDHICASCHSIDECPKDNPGMKKILAYHDGMITLEMQSCAFGKELEQRRLLLEKFVMTNMSDEILLTELSNLDIVKNIKQLPFNDQKALTEILKYIQDPKPQGLFLHGRTAIGKTTLMAGLMNALAKKDKAIGFIHFPTYLIDLKASFSSNENDRSMEKLMKVDYLLLDGIGEENVTSWSRDEILLTILSYRLLNQLPTFFTSMYGYADLKKAYTLKKSDEIRANTIISKLKALSIEIMLDVGKMKI